MRALRLVFFWQIEWLLDCQLALPFRVLVFDHTGISYKIVISILPCSLRCFYVNLMRWVAVVFEEFVVVDMPELVEDWTGKGNTINS
ncbi:MAG: hypothetical protein EZS28_037872 [Streblomastix strix]|uniref:Uncharacterized protein n=1 Tax=Streblomastix strix TaxID=222440 RepID=A0A5J4U9L7_9EUKA|nr:MAG: hypothetical protein EZS28_037872 [Streblomastix strix]